MQTRAAVLLGCVCECSHAHHDAGYRSGHRVVVVIIDAKQLLAHLLKGGSVCVYVCVCVCVCV